MFDCIWLQLSRKFLKTDLKSFSTDLIYVKFHEKNHILLKMYLRGAKNRFLSIIYFRFLCLVGSWPKDPSDHFSFLFLLWEDAVWAVKVSGTFRLFNVISFWKKLRKFLQFAQTFSRVTFSKWHFSKHSSATKIRPFISLRTKFQVLQILSCLSQCSRLQNEQKWHKNKQIHNSV